MGRCTVITCKNSQNKRTRNLRFKFLPKNEHARKVWTQLCGRKFAPNSALICEEHFPPEKIHHKKCLANNRVNCSCKIPEYICKPSLKLPTRKEIIEYASSKKSQLTVTKRSKTRIYETDTSDSEEETDSEPLSKRKATSRLENVAKKRKSSAKLPVYEILSGPAEDDETLEIFSGDENTEPALATDSEPSIFSLQDLCRICAQFKQNSIKIFEEEGLQINLKQKMDLCLPITVCDDDKLPLVVCRECHARLDASYELAMMCGNADKTLSNMLMQHEKLFQPDDTVREINDMLAPEVTFESVSHDTTSPPSPEPDILVISPFNPRKRVRENQESQEDEVSTHLENYESQEDVSSDLENYQSEDAVVGTDLENYQSQEAVVTTDLEKPQSQKAVVRPYRKSHKKQEAVKSSLYHDRPAFYRPKFRCLPCNLSFECNNKGAQHCLKVHHKHMCQNCFAMHSNETQLNNHFTKCQNFIRTGLFVQPQAPDDTVQSKFNCRICTLGSDSIPEASKHSLSVHNMHMCEICSALFSSESSLTAHLRRGHMFTKSIKNIHLNSENTDASPVNKPFVCNVCWKIFQTSETFSKHAETCKQTESKQNESKQNENVEQGRQISATDLSVRRFKNQKMLVPTKQKCKICQCTVHMDGSRSVLQDHYMTKHKAYMCRICLSFHSTDLLDIKTHVLKYHAKIKEKARYLCHFCQKSYYFKSNLKIHISKLHLKAKIIYNCKKCNKKFNSRKLFRIHSITHELSEKNIIYENKVFKCDSCNICEENIPFRYLKIHYKKVHKTFFCDFCTNSSFATVKTLDNHQTTFHDKKITNFYCCHCNIGYRKKSDLKLHIFNKHLQTRKRYTCTTCQTEYYLKSELRSHLRNKHSSENTTFCQMCNYYTFDSLDLHMKSHHEFSCNICCIDLANMHAFGNHHRMYHATGWSYICNICSCKFETEGASVLHSKCHKQKEKDEFKDCLFKKVSKFHCNTCDSYFLNLPLLKIHKLNMHSKSKAKVSKETDFSCSYCPKLFPLKSDLLTHVKTHIICRYCDTGFRSNPALVRHLAHVHNV